MSVWAHPILVAGVGCDLAGDDAAGLEAARRLRDRLAISTSGDVRVVEEAGHLSSLVEQWDGIETAIIVDAAVSGRAPGTIIRCEDSLPPAMTCRFVSTHGFGVLEALEMAKQLGHAPHHVIVYGIEASRTASGDRMSEEVTAAVERVVSEIADRV